MHEVEERERDHAEVVYAKSHPKAGGAEATMEAENADNRWPVPDEREQAIVPSTSSYSWESSSHDSVVTFTGH